VDSITQGRELLIEFGESGYVALYLVTDEHIVVLAVRHQREAGYQDER
jgi:plasmid stabilization system protein ParE